MRVWVAGATALLVIGCSHPLDVRNLREYTAEPSLQPLERSIAVGLVAAVPDRESERLVAGIGGGLGKHAARVYFPYHADNRRAPPVDALVEVGIKPTYKGSGWNFLINFPGFLLWAPAWHGYVYGIDYQIDLKLTHTADRRLIDAWTMPVSLDIRHASMARTWTEVSWLEWGVIALVGGIVFTRYNSDLTELVVDHIDQPLGDRIAADIVRRLNADAGLWTASGAATAAAALAASQAPLPDMPAPAGAAESPEQQPAAQPPLEKGATAKLKPGGTLRNRPTPDGTAIDIGRVTAVRLGSSVRNESGTWWYATAGGKSGWVLESELATQ